MTRENANEKTFLVLPAVAVSVEKAATIKI